MDKQSITGMIVIGVLLIGFMYFTKPSEEQQREIQRRKDSIALVNQQQAKKEVVETLNVEQEQNIQKQILEDSIKNTAEYLSNQERLLVQQYGIFADKSKGEESFITVENDVMKIIFNNKGGKIESVELKEYKTFEGSPLIMYDADSLSTFGMELIVDGKSIFTDEMYFSAQTREENIQIKSGKKSVAFRLEADNNKYIEYLYTIDANDYMLDFDINIVGLSEELRVNPYYTFRWNSLIPSLERKESEWERNNTTIYVKMDNGDVESLGETKEQDEFMSSARVKWIGFKQQFFSSVLIGKGHIDNPIVKLQTLDENNPNYLKKFESEISFPNEKSLNQKAEFAFYFGPNKFSTLQSYDLGMETMVPLGWGIFGWVNRFIVIPIFNWLGAYINSYGLIILFLTLIIKLALFPLTYKSYLSSAKMRILKPQVDELGKKYGKGKEMEKQQAVMALYKKAGASPLGGCLPILLQFPILIALFRFFPASIELRQESFLWAKDLSTFDAIVSWEATIPLISNFYGNHISLFTLLMAVSMIIMTMLTNSNQAANPNMPGMKTMMYMMPVFMIVWFNSYASGLSYYYFLANLITIIQTLVIRKFIIDEDKVLAAMEAKKKKPIKKSKWQLKLEEAQKKAQQRQKGK